MCWGSCWRSGRPTRTATSGRCSRRNRSIASFGRARERVSRRITFPATLSLAVTGVAIMAVTSYPISDPAARWLQVSIVLYAGMVGYIVLVLDRLNARISDLGFDVFHPGPVQRVDQIAPDEVPDPGQISHAATSRRTPTSRQMSWNMQ